jgi:hypothetical protein
MAVKLEVGKRYVRNDGRIVEIWEEVKRDGLERVFRTKRIKSISGPEHECYEWQYFENGSWCGRAKDYFLSIKREARADERDPAEMESSMSDDYGRSEEEDTGADYKRGYEAGRKSVIAEMRGFMDVVEQDT